MLSVLPLFHSFGQTCNQNSTILGGARLTYMEKFDPEDALRVMERDKVTIFAGVPTMYFQLLAVSDANHYDLSSLRYCFSGGAALPVQVMRDFEARYEVKILEGYGLSETSPVATFSRVGKEYKEGSIGEAVYGCEVKIFDPDDNELPAGEVGEIVIRGYNIMKGYYKRAEATAEAFRSGWFHSGDMGKKDEDGYLFIVDRKKDMIIRGGFNVYPREVEEVLYTHPKVLEAAVIGIPDEARGEVVKVFVSARDGESLTPEEITAFLQEQTAKFKWPKEVEVLDALPVGPTGKILKRELKGA